MKDITGFEGYKIDEIGRVYSKKVNRYLRPFINKKGYYIIRLNKDNKQYSFLVHRLVAFVYLGLDIKDRKIQINHLDEDKSNNYYKNLDLVSNRENKFYSVKGYHWDKIRNKWRVALRNDDGKLNYVGRYDLEEDAKKAVVEFYEKMKIKNKYLNYEK